MNCTHKQNLKKKKVSIFKMPPKLEIQKKKKKNKV